MSSGFGSESEFLERLATRLRHGPERIMLVLGAGRTTGAPPWLETVIQVADEYALYRHNDDLLAAIEQAKQEATDLADLHTRYRLAFSRWVGPSDFDIVVQQAVIRRHRVGGAPPAGRGPWQRIDLRTAERMEGDTASWAMPIGVAALGGLLAQVPDRFGNRVLTTNVDPLLEIAVRRAGGRAIPMTPGFDNFVSSAVPGRGTVQVVHLNGYWRAVRPEHHRAVLLEPDQRNLPAELTSLLTGKTVYVVGYDGGHRALSAALAELTASQRTTVYWSLPAPVGEAEDPLPDAGRQASVTVYAGVDGARLFSRLAARSGVRFLPTVPQPAEGTEVRQVLQPELARRAGATPLRQQAEDASDVLRQLALRFDWRVERQRNLPVPTLLFWPVRLRRPSVIHMVQAFAAAALSVHQVRVVLTLDDFGDPPRDTTADAFAERIRNWFALVRGAREPDIVLLSKYVEDHDVFAAPPGPDTMLRPTRPWAIAREYYGEFDPSAYSVLSAVKILPDIEPDQALVHAREVVEALLSQSANRLLTPLTLWSHLGHLLLNSPGNQTVTLGGDDERRFWAHWRDMSHELTGHVYHPRIANVTNESTLMYWEHADDLRRRLEETVDADLWRERDRYIPWLVRNALMLPAYLRGGRGVELRGRPFDVWQDVLTAMQTDRSLLEPIAQRISGLFLYGEDL